MDQASLLDAMARVVGTQHEPASDYRLAKELGCTRQHISMVRSGSRFLDDELALELARRAKLDPGYVLTVIAGQRAKRTESRRAWQSVAKRLAGVAMGLFLAGFFGPESADWGVIAVALAAIPVDPNYGLCALIGAIAAARIAVALTRGARIGFGPCEPSRTP